MTQNPNQEASDEAEQQKLTKMKEANERLKYRIRILEEALADTEKKTN